MADAITTGEHLALASDESRLSRSKIVPEPLLGEKRGAHTEEGYQNRSLTVRAARIFSVNPIRAAVRLGGG